MALLRCVFFMFPLLLLGQSSFTIENDFILFEEAATGEPILVYNDSMAVRGFDFKDHFKIKFPEGLKPAYFNKYHYQIGVATYLVDNGGGVVLQFIDNSFKRIDNSFRHKNQYKAVPFAKDSSLYLYGGYGLFTHKNILTNYSFETKEWARIQTKNEAIVPPSLNSLFWQSDNALYVFAGQTVDTDNILNKIRLPNTVWQLNLGTLAWEINGEHDLYNYFPNFIRTPKFYTDHKLVLLKYDISEVDITNNDISKYSFNNYKAFKKVIYHKASGYVSYVYETTKNDLAVASEPYSDFKGELVSSVPFYKTSILPTRILTGSFIGVLLVLLVVCFVYFRRSKTATFKGKVIIYDTKSDTFSYNNNTIKTLGQFKKQLLVGFMHHGERYILLNELNELLNKDTNQNENHTALQKRREVLLKELKSDLSIILNISEDKVFSVRKYKYDKRLREIKLEVKIIKK